MTTRGHKWSATQRRRFIKTMRLRREQRNGGLKAPAPDLIYILVHGKLKAFRLRTMPIYLPEEDLR